MRVAGNAGADTTLVSDVVLKVDLQPDFTINKAQARWRFQVGNSGVADASTIIVTNTQPLGFGFDTLSVVGNNQEPKPSSPASRL